MGTLHAYLYFQLFSSLFYFLKIKQLVCLVTACDGSWHAHLSPKNQRTKNKQLEHYRNALMNKETDNTSLEMSLNPRQYMAYLWAGQCAVCLAYGSACFSVRGAFLCSSSVVRCLVATISLYLFWLVTHGSSPTSGRSCTTMFWSLPKDQWAKPNSLGSVYWLVKGFLMI